MHSIVPPINANKTSPHSTLLAGQGRKKNARFTMRVFSHLWPAHSNAENKPAEHMKNKGGGEEWWPDSQRVKSPSVKLFFSLSITCLLITKDAIFQAKARHVEKMIARLVEVSRRRGPSLQRRQWEQKRFLHVLGWESCLTSIRLGAMQIASLNRFFFFILSSSNQLKQAADVCFNYLWHQTQDIPRCRLTDCKALWLSMVKNC